VIATCRDGTEISEIVLQCGIVVEPEDSGKLAAAVLTLADNKKMRLELGRRARILAETHFERDAVLGAMFGSLETGEPSVANDVAV
jgi:colanic acid biosynthesis glycosyl transferase WcaI